MPLDKGLIGQACELRNFANALRGVLDLAPLPFDHHEHQEPESEIQSMFWPFPDEENEDPPIRKTTAMRTMNIRKKERQNGSSSV